MRLCTTLGRIAFVLFLAATVSPAQSIITTIAGTTTAFRGDGAQATSVGIGYQEGLAVDAAGNIYICDSENHLVLKVIPSGTITILAGNGQPGFSGDGGPARNASLNTPFGLSADGSGNVYIADTNNHRIRKVDVNGI